MNTRSPWLLGLTLLCSPVLAAEGDEVVSFEYRFAPAINSEVLADRETEYWARVYRPKATSAAPLPVVMFLHGNHATCRKVFPRRGEEATCDYTDSGKCPEGYEVIPNHAGYEDVSKSLVKSGAVVVSINANRGITCASRADTDAAGIEDWSLNLARGRLVLAHLQLLSLWNEGAGPSMPAFESNLKELQGQLDLERVGVVGHSRGGEGVRAAYNYIKPAHSAWRERNPKLRIQGIFEIAPVDGQAPPVLNPDSLPWAVLLPHCDGDVRTMMGMRVFDRMYSSDDWSFQERVLTPKAAVAIYGANHNGFNSEWGLSDSLGCVDQMPIFPIYGASRAQTKILDFFTGAFFRSHLKIGSEKEALRAFSPRYPLPDSISSISDLSRDYLSGVSGIYARFYGGMDGDPNFEVSQVKLEAVRSPNHGHAISTRSLEWARSGSDVYFLSKMVAPASLENYRHLEFRVAALRNDELPKRLDFSIQLQDSSGALSVPVQLSSALALYQAPERRELMHIARFPLKVFAGINPAQVVGVRWTFDRTTGGKILLSDPKLSATEPADEESAPREASPQLARGPTVLSAPTDVISYPATYRMSVTSVRLESMLKARSKMYVKVRVRSNHSFQARGAMFVAEIGDQAIRRVMHSPGNAHELIVFLTAEEALMLEALGSARVYYEGSADQESWRLSRD